MDNNGREYFRDTLGYDWIVCPAYGCMNHDPHTQTARKEKGS